MLSHVNWESSVKGKDAVGIRNFETDGIYAAMTYTTICISKNFISQIHNIFKYIIYEYILIIS